MKLRLRENSVRIRLLKSEIAALAENGLITETIMFGTGQALIYSVSVKENARRIAAAFEDGRISISIPGDVADTWINSEETALTYDQVTNDDISLNILIEKDFVCLSRPMEGDNLDAFPNPESEVC